ncbi:DUF4432 family protein [Paenibacillus sp. Dod16]|uniref:DUF4432 family protein n=1 Tax=unclassified Paenibacillus TaxID=185978 RepID=UPI0035C07AC1
MNKKRSQKGLVGIRTLNYFVQSKMFGVKDYVLGFEPRNCHPDGREAMRRENTLKFISPGESVTYHMKTGMIDGIQ